MSRILHTNAADIRDRYETELWGTQPEAEETADAPPPAGGAQHDPLTALTIDPATAAIEASQRKQEREEATKLKTEERDREQEQHKEEKDERIQERRENRQSAAPAMPEPIRHTSSRTSTGTGRT